MMDLATIHELSRRAASRAKRAHKVPWLAEPFEVERAKAGEVGRVNIPFLGDYVPRAWKRTDRDLFFVDSSGFGSPSEPALTLPQFFCQMVPGCGYAVVEAGQFQVYVAEYRRRPRKGKVSA